MIIEKVNNIFWRSNCACNLGVGQKPRSPFKKLKNKFEEIQFHQKFAITATNNDRPWNLCLLHLHHLSFVAFWKSSHNNLYWFNNYVLNKCYRLSQKTILLDWCCQIGSFLGTINLWIMRSKPKDIIHQSTKR